jgi:hypothetical protein
MSRWPTAAPVTVLALGLGLVWAPAAAEEPAVVTLDGTVTYLVVDEDEPDPASDELETIATVTVDGIPVVVPEAQVAGLVSGDQVDVSVTAPAGLDEAAVVDALSDGAPGVAVVEVNPSADVFAATTLAPVLGPQTITVVPVTWGVGTLPSTAELEALGDTAAAYWAQQSAGRIAFATPVVVPPRAVAAPATCDDVVSAVYASATAGLPAPSGTNHVVVYFPESAVCGWAGLASVGGGQVWVNGSLLPDVLTHELGHNFGLGHAHRITCSTDGVRVPLAFPVASACTAVGYGDWADVMGVALGGSPVPRTGSLNVAMADAIGLATVVDTAAVAGPVTLAPISSAAGTRGLRTAVTQGLVYTEYRPATGPDERLTQVSMLRGWAGVEQRLALDDPSGARSTYLLDLQPAQGVFVAPVLPVGTSTTVASTATTVITAGTGGTATMCVSGSAARTESYIRAVYRDLFGRDVDPTGLAAWRLQLLCGTPRIAVANAITGSAEFRAGLIQQSYATYLGRAAEPAGLASWLLEMGAGMTQERMEAGFLASDEYYAQSGLDDASWVRRLYRHVLGREAGEGEVGYWVAGLRSGRGRYGVALGFLLSTEHLASVVDGHYLRLLGRHLDPSGLATWVGALQGGVRIEGVVGGIVASDEYFQRL